tara:strand:+ start:1318 stop:1656 length:339 start_codon:yes stop_codon:yes gene_type:complete
MKKYKTIKEVSNLLNINQHVIRYWDSKFDGLSIRFSKKKQRYFNNEHIKKIEDLKETLYQNGKHNYSLDLAKKIINNKKNNYDKKTDYLDTKKNTLDVKKLMNIRDSLNKLL